MTDCVEYIIMLRNEKHWMPFLDILNLVLESANIAAVYDARRGEIGDDTWPGDLRLVVKLPE